MTEIHMGELLERAVRQKGISVTAFAIALDIDRRTLYNWFKQQTINELTMRKISGVMISDTSEIKILPKNTNSDNRSLNGRNWQDKYIDLLEKYTKMIAILEQRKSN